MNYSKNKSAPVKGGRLSDVVKPRKRRFTRVPAETPAEVVVALKMDLVQVLADLGIVLSNVHTIARHLVQKGWIQSKKIEKDIQ